MKQQTKPAVQSKTVGLNILSLVSVSLTALLADPSFTELVGGFIVMLLNITLIGIRIFDTDTKIDGIIKPKPTHKERLEMMDEVEDEGLV